MDDRNVSDLTLVAAKKVISAKAGIQKDYGFLRIKYEAGSVEPGMTSSKD